MMLVVLEGIIMCFVLLIICVVGIANGPEGMVFFYEKEVQDKAVELGLTTRETIKKRKGITFVALMAPQFFLVPLMVYFVNGTSDFKTAAIQMTVIYHNGKVYTDTGKKVAGNVIHLLPNPEKALRELERVVKPGGRIIIPTYINMSKGTGTAAVKFITLLGADFKRQFNLE